MHRRKRVKKLAKNPRTNPPGPPIYCKFGTLKNVEYILNRKVLHVHVTLKATNAYFSTTEFITINTHHHLKGSHAKMVALDGGPDTFEVQTPNMIGSIEREKGKLKA